MGASEISNDAFDFGTHSRIRNALLSDNDVVIGINKAGKPDAEVQEYAIAIAISHRVLKSLNIRINDKIKFGLAPFGILIEPAKLGYTGPTYTVCPRTAKNGTRASSHQAGTIMDGKISRARPKDFIISYGEAIVYKKVVVKDGQLLLRFDDGQLTIV
jgi:hypothetical protein